MVRLLATDILTIGYVNVGEFIKSMTDDEVQTLIHGIEEDNEQQYQEMILVSEMLATGEGCEPSQNDEQFESRAHQLITLLILESLHRKGLVKLYHENISFHEDMGDKLLVEKINI